MDRLKTERHERMYGPHFDEETAMKAVSNMENEDGSKGLHWDLDQTTAVAQQYNVNLKSDKFNKYDWFVALNMVRSDYYKVIVSITNSDNVRYFVELAKAWLNDKDVAEGKMWYYYKYVICDKLREPHTEDEDEDDDEYEDYRMSRMPRTMRRTRKEYNDWDDDDDYYDRRRMVYRREPMGKYMSRY